MVGPEGAPRFWIERQNVVGRLRDVHDSVDNQRRRLKLLQRLRLKYPFHFQFLDVRRADLFKLTIALA